MHDPAELHPIIPTRSDTLILDALTRYMAHAGAAGQSPAAGARAGGETGRQRNGARGAQALGSTRHHCAQKAAALFCRQKSVCMTAFSLRFKTTPPTCFMRWKCAASLSPNPACWPRAPAPTTCWKSNGGWKRWSVCTGYRFRRAGGLGFPHQHLPRRR